MINNTKLDGMISMLRSFNFPETDPDLRVNEDIFKVILSNSIEKKKTHNKATD